MSEDQISPGIATLEVWNRTYPSADGWRIGVETSGQRVQVMARNCGP